MNTDLKRIENPLSLELSTTLESVKEYARESKAANTRRAYATDWKDFTAYCEENKLAILPASPETLALYISSLADRGYKRATIERRVAAISQAHKLQNLPTPYNDQVKEIFKGVKRHKAQNGEGVTQKAALTYPDLMQLIGFIPNTRRGIRDLVMILLGFAGFLRRSELCSLMVKNLEFVERGVILHLGQTKTEENSIVAIEKGVFPITCPVENLRRWLNVSGITGGAVFRQIDKGGKMGETAITPDGFIKILKGYCLEAGIDPAKIAGHSLRAGGATQAALNRVGETFVKKHGRWRSAVYQRYIRPAKDFENNPSASLGL